MSDYTEIIRAKVITEAHNQLDELLVKLQTEHKMTFYELRAVVALLTAGIDARFDIQLTNKTINDMVQDYETDHAGHSDLYR